MMSNEPPQGAHSADPVREAAQRLLNEISLSPQTADHDQFAQDLELVARTALAAPRPEPEKFNLHDVVPPSAPEWVEGNRASVSSDWMSGWDACRNRTRLLVIGLVAAMRQALAAPEGPAPEPDCWAILTPNGSMLVSPDEAKGRKGAYPLYRAPEAPPPVEARQPPQSELAKSLAWSNDDGWRAQRLATEFHEIYERLAPSFGYETRPDTKQFDPNSKNGKLMIAVCGSILAALAAPAGAIQPHLDHQVGAPVTPLPLESAGGAPSATAPREHEANEHCWCEPEVDYVDPNTGAKVFVHKQTQ